MIGSWRHLCGAIIAALGTIILFSPNSDSINNWYTLTIPSFRNISAGMDQLTSFDFDTDRNDYRQPEKSLEAKDVGFDEILKILKRVDPKKLSSLPIISITNRRDYTHREGTGEYLDVLNVIHVHAPNTTPPYRLITTETDLRARISTYRNIWINVVGTAVVLLGMFSAYIWQGFIFLYELCIKRNKQKAVREIPAPVNKQKDKKSAENAPVFYQRLTTHIDYVDNKIYQFLSLYFTLSVAIIGGAFYLAHLPGGKVKDDWAWKVNWLLSLVSVGTLIFIGNYLRAWWDWRKTLYDNFEDIPAPGAGGIWWWISEAAMFVLIIAIWVGFCFHNPLSAPN